MLSFCFNDCDYFSRIGDVMRLLCILAICIFASVNLFAADLLPLTEDGFGGIKWGTEYSDKLGMGKCVDNGRQIVCKKSEESLKEIAGVPVDVVYIFRAAFFNNVHISFKDPLKWPTITKALTKTYGKSMPVYVGELMSKGFAYSTKIGETSIDGIYHNSRQVLYIASSNTVTDDAMTNRFDKMALSTFTGAERKSLKGFLGVTWDMTAKQIPHKLLLLADLDGYVMYLQIENLYFGFIPVDLITYIFID
ncbi:MAG: hypothetical protein LBV04_10110, partial [Deferribacteraceae bacterium]|nr:hypothetical protein [Deferribacteraceae bacterium]